MENPLPLPPLSGQSTKKKCFLRLPLPKAVVAGVVAPAEVGGGGAQVPHGERRVPAILVHHGVTNHVNDA